MAVVMALAPARTFIELVTFARTLHSSYALAPASWRAGSSTVALTVTGALILARTFTKIEGRLNAVAFFYFHGLLSRLTLAPASG